MKRLLKFLVTILFTSLTACSAKVSIDSESERLSSVANSNNYFSTESTLNSTLTQLSEKVWTYNYYFDRGLIIDTEVGFVVIDSFSPHYVSGLLNAIGNEGIHKPVHTLIYSHYHMDHTLGGDNLFAQQVICHVKCLDYWDDFKPEAVASVAAVTHVLEDDFPLSIGGTKIQMIYLENSHTDTMFAVYLPDEKILFAADTVGIDVFLPSGGISLYYPAYLKALDKLQALDFDLFVSSHFGWGSKEDYIAAADMQRDIYRWAGEALEKYSDKDTGVPIFQDQARMTGAYAMFYAKMKAKYGNWHGFDAQIFSTFTSALTAHYIGS